MAEKKAVEQCEQLLRLAVSSGASDAACLSPGQVSVNRDFVKFCQQASCSGYGKAPSCPPHAVKTDFFQQQLAEYTVVLVLKVDALVEDLSGPNRIWVSGKVHRLVHLLEQKAKTLGFTKTFGVAAGSCKEIFCHEFTDCPVLENKACRFPHGGRVSMSAVGVDVAALCTEIGWELSWDQFAEKDNEGEKKGIMVGMVLLDL